MRRPGWPSPPVYDHATICRGLSPGNHPRALPACARAQGTHDSSPCGGGNIFTIALCAPPLPHSTSHGVVRAAIVGCTKSQATHRDYPPTHGGTHSLDKRTTHNSAQGRGESSRPSGGSGGGGDPRLSSYSSGSAGLQVVVHLVMQVDVVRGRDGGTIQGHCSIRGARVERRDVTVRQSRAKDQGR